MFQRIDGGGYQDRLNRVTNHIHDHLDEPIDLDRLAGIACLSPWHWHRIYHAMQGETAVATVRRLRLHRAAGQLAMTTLPIEVVAERAGYGSERAFSRAFGDVYGMPPATYRKSGDHARFQVPAVGSGDERLGVDHGVTIRDLPPVDAFAMAHRGSYMQIDRAFGELYGWLRARNLVQPGMRLLGVYGDDPTAVAEAELRSHAAVDAGVPVIAEAPVEAIAIRGGPYAVLRHKGPYASMRATYLWLYGAWLPRSGREAADAPVIEEYLNNPRDTPPGELLTDICLPLREVAP